MLLILRTAKGDTKPTVYPLPLPPKNEVRSGAWLGVVVLHSTYHAFQTRVSSSKSAFLRAAT